MNYNFTTEVRQSLARARAEALRLGHEHVGTEHILLGLLFDEAAVDDLGQRGISVAAVRRQVEEAVPRGLCLQRDGDLPYTRSGKKVLELAMTRARDSQSGAVTTIHLLEGLYSENSGIAAQVLRKLGYAGGAQSGVGGRARSSGFHVVIDDNSTQSIYEQIVAQITEASATGRVSAGERLPTVRQMADELDVAPGTVARAYSELEQQGLIVTDGARGTRMSPRPTSPLKEEERRATLTGLLRPVAVAAFHLGATAIELRAALTDAMKDIFDDRDAVARSEL
jgi:DNA-binding transcriptional regulator YhcF (GntR family)